MHYKAVVFDWAGTMIDFGSFAPTSAFTQAFAAFQIAVTVEEAREPMGMAKRDHIKAMLNMPRIAALWQKTRGAPATEADIDQIYKIFIPLNEDVVTQHAVLVPGAREMLDDLRSRGMKIGSTTGYTRSIMERVLPVAAAQGYEPDNLVCSDDLKEGRPGPLGMYQCCVDLCIYPLNTIIKVDDTEPGIAEGVSAGCLTIGLSLSGNYVGKTPDELAAMSSEDIDELRQIVIEKLKGAGADHVIDTVADLPALLDHLESHR